MNKKIATNDMYLKSLMAEYFENRTEIVLCENISEIDADLLLLNNYSGSVPPELFEKTKILNLHPSLLPAFANKNALSQAYTSGVKVSGVTVHYVEKNNFYGRIIAQYPIFIDCDMHYNEYVEALTSTGNKLYPPVASAVLNDKVFDFSEIFKHKCSAGCSSCSGCKK
jgi:phosphoribosylglycinamide formyltransferase-1